jgi:hypothetical protein
MTQKNIVQGLRIHDTILVVDFKKFNDELLNDFPCTPHLVDGMTDRPDACCSQTDFGLYCTNL